MNWNMSWKILLAAIQPTLCPYYVHTYVCCILSAQKLIPEIPEMGRDDDMRLRDKC